MNLLTHIVFARIVSWLSGPLVAHFADGAEREATAYQDAVATAVALGNGSNTASAAALANAKAKELLASAVHVDMFGALIHVRMVVLPSAWAY